MQKPTVSDRTRILIILSILENGEQTGFSLITEMEKKHQFAFAFEEGFIYPLLHQMQQYGWITSYEKKTEVGIRRFYKIKRLGSRFLSHKGKHHRLHEHERLGGGVCAKSADKCMAKTGNSSYSKSDLPKSCEKGADCTFRGQNTKTEK